MRHFGRLALILILLPPIAASADPPADLTAEYLARYNKLDPKDIPARLALADWCASKSLDEYRVQVLTEVLWIDPKHESAYKLLLDADLRRNRPIDKQAAADLESLLGRDYRLHHTPHFTILTDAADATVANLARALEDAYRAFYKECSSIGLHPMPPSGRLVCILFSRYTAYRDYLSRVEHISADWMSGYYSSQTNRCIFFDDRDNLAFKSVHEQLSRIDVQMASIRADLLAAKAADTQPAQRQLTALNAERNDIIRRLDAVSRITTTSKVRHEVAHQLFATSGLLQPKRDYPFWLAEALAMLFEMPAGQANVHRLKTYRRTEAEGRLLPIARLLSASVAEGDSAQDAAEIYAQTWALAHYLWTEHPAELKAYLAAFTAAPPADALAQFRQFFGSDLDAVERDLRKHIASLPRGGQ